VDGSLKRQDYHWVPPAGFSWPAPFDIPFEIRINHTVGGTWPGSPDGTTVWPQFYYIDYVRIYDWT
jgi:hypothetical protein